MYLEYFGLSEPPFSIAPNPRYLYLTQQHQEALAHLNYGLGSTGGVVLLTGEVGTGKTTISRKLLEDLPAHIDVAWIVNPRLSAQELLASVCDELTIPYASDVSSIKALTDLINAYLIEAHGRGRNVVVMIDEAQNLSPEVLEQLRLLTNLETSERKLLQIILLGQPELKIMLERTDLRQLAQRITARYHLHALSSDECKEYIRHRLAIGGCDRPVFSNASSALIFQHSHGTPRLINLLCDRALLGAYACNDVMVAPKHVRQAANEVMGDVPQVSKTKWFVACAVALGLVFANAVLLQRIWPQISGGAQVSGDKQVLDNKQVSDKRQTTATKQSPDKTQAPQDIQNHIQRIDAPPTVQNHATLPIKAPALMVAAKAISPAKQAMLQTEGTIAQAVDAPPVVDSKPLAVEQAAKTPPATVWSVIEQRGSKPLAFATLLALWQENPNSKAQSCEHLANTTTVDQPQLACLQQRTNSWLLREYNRPAMFQTIDSDGKARYAVIRAVQHGKVVIQLGTQHWNVSMQALEQHWIEDVTLLWLQPAGYQADIQAGDTGAMVTWLANKMDAIQGKMIPAQDSYSMNNVLVERVKGFQQSEGLPADGVVGPLTLIRINERMDQHTPRLNRGELF